MITLELLTSEEILSDMCENAAIAALTCRGNEDKYEDTETTQLLARLIKAGHESVIEHINLTFRIEGVSRALLQEIARHRHLSLSVQSTRYCMDKMLRDIDESDVGSALALAMSPFKDRISDDVYNDFIKAVTDMSCSYIAMVEHIGNELPSSVLTNDVLKYLLPELIPCRLVMTCNLRELRHLFKLRLSKHALYEFRTLMVLIWNALPACIKELVNDVIDADLLNEIEGNLDIIEISQGGAEDSEQ